MPDDAAFLAAIRDQPLDDLRRVVYADWLDEQGRSAEAEYLRLVAALAEPGTPINMTHSHAFRLLALAERIDHTWREAAGGRFDLWIDPPLDPARLINFIKTARELTGLGLGELKHFCYTLPRALNGGLPLEEVVAQLQALHQSAPPNRMLPMAEVPTRGMLRRDIVLRWDSNFHQGRSVTTTEQTRAALSHLRRILANAAETTPLADGVPEATDQNDWMVVLSVARPVSEIDRWRKRLCIGDYFHGHTADPPFSGSISVRAWH